MGARSGPTSTRWNEHARARARTRRRAIGRGDARGALLAALLAAGCRLPPALPAGASGAPCVFAVQADGDASFDALAPACGVALTGLAPSVVLRAGGARVVRAAASFPERSARSEGGVLALHLGGRCDAPDLDLLVAPDPADGSLALRAVLTAPAAAALEVEGVELQAEPPAGGVVLGDPGDDLHLLHDGYQSWSFAGVEDLAPGFTPATGAGGEIETSEDPVAEQAGVSWWNVALRRARGGPTVVVGALTARARKSYFAVGLPGGTISLRAVVGADGDATPLAPGGAVALEPLWIGAAWRPADVLAAYAAAVAAATGAGGAAGTRARLPHALPARGWTSWYAFFSNVAASDLPPEQALLARAPLAADGFSLLHLDDGYEVQFGGDWSENAKFPAGLPAVAQAARGAGLAAGLWFEPFLVAETSELARDHLDWMVRAPGGGPLEDHSSGLGGHYVLDATDPPALAWLEAQVQAFAADGFTELKLDFLYAGALPGVRHDPSVTPLQAYRRALAALAAAAGPGVLVVASGAPILPTLGLADALRTGRDVVFANTAAPAFPLLADEMRQLAARSYLCGRLVLCDPDAVVVRAPLTDGEARMAATVAACAGGLYLLGDDLTALPPSRLDEALDADLLAAQADPRPPVPEDLMDAASTTLPEVPQLFSDPGSLPARWDKPAGGRTLRAVFDLAAHDVALSTDGSADGGP